MASECVYTVTITRWIVLRAFWSGTPGMLREMGLLWHPAAWLMCARAFLRVLVFGLGGT